jgi:uncharacterized protein
MSTVNKVTAEPRMDDLLASIRRAIHDEGMEASEAKPGFEIDDLLETGDAPPPKSPIDVRPAPIAARRPPEHLADRRSADSQEIVALRSKISRELNQDESPSVASAPSPVKPQPIPQRLAAQQPASLFKNLLGGDDRREPVQSSATTAPQQLRPSVNDSAPAAPESMPSHAQGRPAVLPTAPRRPAQVYPLRSAIDAPGSGGNGQRPPFGQSSMGIRNFHPTAEAVADAMMSPETSTTAAGSFSRLAEQMFGREGGKRSIDDLARELLHPMLKQWLDQNLARIVEQLVREEIERVARRGSR